MDGATGPRPVSTSTAEHYTWGRGCDGWHFVRRAELSVIRERMPPATSEARHFHTSARQFFYVLSGFAVLEVEGVETTLSAGEGLEVPPGAPHQMFNRSQAPLEFLVVSQPHSHGDRTLATTT
jgi:mannose-6-phosphate isomerase-like protein (cupin superfamily)